MSFILIVRRSFPNMLQYVTPSRWLCRDRRLRGHASIELLLILKCLIVSNASLWLESSVSFADYWSLNQCHPSLFAALSRLDMIALIP
jgi:hypothetical protein